MLWECPTHNYMYIDGLKELLGECYGDFDSQSLSYCRFIIFPPCSKLGSKVKTGERVMSVHMVNGSIVKP